MISVPRGKDDLSLYRGIPSPLALAPWGFGQLLPAVSFSSCEFCNEQRNVLSVSLHPFIFRKRHWSTRYTQFAMILAGVLLGQITYPYAPFGANTATETLLSLTRVFFYRTLLTFMKKASAGRQRLFPFRALLICPDSWSAAPAAARRGRGGR